MSDIKLDGGEIMVLKAVGLGGSSMDGDTLVERCKLLDEHEFVDIVRGLIICGYLNCDKRSLHSAEDVKLANFHVNSGYARELRDAMDPRSRRPQKRSRRVRRE